MPTAEPRLRRRMGVLFGDQVGDVGPIDFLRRRGFLLRPDWGWDPRPGLVRAEDMTEDERDCVVFLIQEWDFDGVHFDQDKEGQDGLAR